MDIGFSTRREPKKRVTLFKDIPRNHTFYRISLFQTALPSSTTREDMLASACFPIALSVSLVSFDAYKPSSLHFGYWFGCIYLLSSLVALVLGISASGNVSMTCFFVNVGYNVTASTPG